MEIFKGNRNVYFVKTDNAKEKKALFKIIPKRERSAIYFHPDGKRQEQFQVTTQEADTINKEWREVT